MLKKSSARPSVLIVFLVASMFFPLQMTLPPSLGWGWDSYPAAPTEWPPNPADDAPESGMVSVYIDEACFTAKQLEGQEKGQLINILSAYGHTEGPVLYGSYTWTYLFANGSRITQPWSPGDPRLLLPIVTHIRFSGLERPEDWSNWALEGPWFLGRPPEDIVSITLWVRVFQDWDGRNWSQESRVLYSSKYGYLCVMSQDGSGVFSHPEVAFFGGIGLAIVASPFVFLGWRRLRSKLGFKDGK